jgi:hypothetical protein
MDSGPAPTPECCSLNAPLAIPEGPYIGTKKRQYVCNTVVATLGTTCCRLLSGLKRILRRRRRKRGRSRSGPGLYGTPAFFFIVP